METTDLASSIGLGTRQEAAFKGMTLTNFANKEYQINANNARIEAERKKKEAELENSLKESIKLTGKYDKIAAPTVQQAYVDMIRGGYKNPQKKYEFELLKQNHELASAARKEQSDLLNKADLLIDPKVKSALINNDIKQLEILSKDPNSGIVKDEQLPDTYTLAAEARIPRVANITAVTKKFVPTDEANLDRSQTKLLKTVGGKNIYGTPVKESALDQAAVEVMSNPMYAANWAKVYETDINKMISSGVPLKQALINSFKDKNRFVEADSYTPPKGDSNESVWFNNNGQFESKSGWTATPDKDGIFLLNTKSPSGVGEQLVRVSVTSKNPVINPVTKKPAVINGSPILRPTTKEVDLMIRPSSVKYLGDDKWELVAKEGNDKGTYEVQTQSLKSVIGEKMVDDLKKASGDKKYRPKYVSAKSVVGKNTISTPQAQPTKTTKKETPQERAARIAAGG
jgi:hypothetical protein